MNDNYFSPWGWLLFSAMYLFGSWRGYALAEQDFKERERDAELQRLREEINRLKASS